MLFWLWFHLVFGLPWHMEVVDGRGVSPPVSTTDDNSSPALPAMSGLGHMVPVHVSSFFPHNF
jgi:hypothetical protein